MAFGFSISCFYLLPKHLTVSYAASPGQVGAVVGIFGLISVLIVPWLGRTVSALGLPRTLFLAQLLMAASAFAFASLDGIGATMMVLRALQGLATAGFMTASMAMVCELAPAHRLGQAMGFAGAASLIMNAIAPAVAEPVGARYGFAWVFLLSGAAALVGALIARRLPQAAQPAEASTRPTFPRQAYTVLLAVAISSAGFYVVMAFLAPLALSRGIGAVGGFFVAYTIAALAMRTVGSAAPIGWASGGPPGWASSPTARPSRPSRRSVLARWPGWAWASGWRTARSSPRSWACCSTACCSRSGRGWPRSPTA